MTRAPHSAAGGYLIKPPQACLVLRAEGMIQLHGDLVIHEWNRKVVAIEVPWQVGCGKEGRAKLLGHRIQAAGGDDIVRERDSLRCCGRHGCRISHGASGRQRWPT